MQQTLREVKCDLLYSTYHTTKDEDNPEIAGPVFDAFYDYSRAQVLSKQPETITGRLGR